MPEIVRIRVEVDQRSNAAITQIVGLKKTIDEINATHINVQVDNANQLEQITRKMTAYNNSVARRIQAELQLATAIENRKGEESKAQAAAERRKAAEERTAQSIERTRQAEERTRQAEERTRQAIERTAQTKERTTQITERARLAQERANTAARQGADANTILGTSLTGLVTRFVSLHMLLSRTVSAFRDALKTMKDVDTALVTIQKTTGYTGQQLDRLTNSAYELANAYGRTATEILNAASVYARAGFKDNLDQMTELSALLQNVGDLEGEVASKFLIATNAAWKLNGSYDALMGVIDGLNAQTNQAAVDMEGLTSGITVAGSVFAAAGETVQTFAGMLGAGIALTARSGSEVGRGLRTIAMNIRQIKGELEDGEIIDEESISDAAKALHSVGISVADANGELRLTSDVLNELAGRWNNLTSAEQSYLAQSLAGKRQANILVSLMQNWEEAQRQMELYANGAGSAIQENEIYLDSWEAKTKQLSAAWTKFVNNLVDTKLIKGALDALIKLVDLLDSKLGRFVITVGGISTAFMALVGAIKGITAAVAALNGVMSINPLFLAAAGITAGIYLLVKALEDVTSQADEYARAARETYAAYQSTQSEIDGLKNKTEELTDQERARLEILKEEARLRKEQAAEQAKQALASKYSVYAMSYDELQYKLEKAPRSEAADIINAMHKLENGKGLPQTSGGTGIPQYAGMLIGQYADIKKALEDAFQDHKSLEELNKLEEESRKLQQSIIDLSKELLEYSEIMGEDFPEEAQSALTYLNIVIDAFDGVRESTKKAGDAADDASEPVDKLRENLQALSDEADAADDAFAAVTDALNKYGEGSVQVYDAMRKLEETLPGATDNLYDFETAAWKVDAAQFADKQSLLDFIDAARQAKLTPLIEELQRATDAALEYAGSIALAMPEGTFDNSVLDMIAYNPKLQQLKREKADWDAWVSTLRQRSDYTGTTTTTKTTRTTTSEPTTDPELQRLQNIVALRKQELSFLQASGASQDEINAKQKAIQAALHDVAEHLRLSEAYLNEDEKAVAEVLALSTEWWQIQKQIDDTGEDILQTHKDEVALLKSELDFLKASGASDDKIIAKQKEIQAALHKQAEYMRSVGASQTEINALSTEWWNIQNDILSIQEAQVKKQQELFDTLKKTIDEYYNEAVSDKEKELEYEEKILEVQKAQVALANAQKERTVRYFNSATGQWEWGANQKNVKSAQDNLKKAQEALTNYQTEQAWTEFKSAWEYIAGQIRSGDVTFAEAYQYMYNKMTGIQDKYDVDMSGVLNDSIGGFKDLNTTISGLDEQTAKQLGESVGKINTQNANLATATGNTEKAVGELKSAFDKVKKEIESGETDIDTGFKYIKDKANEIADKYGVNMKDEVDKAIQEFKTIYSGLDGISKAVQEGALTPDEAFDIISKALNSVSEEYGEDITGEVNKILKQEGGFENGLSDLAESVKTGKTTWKDAFDLLTGAVDQTSEKFGITGLQGSLDTAITNMGNSAGALDDLWKTIVTSKMRANSISWLELDAQEKKAKAAGDTATVEAIQAEKARLHAENVSLGETIGATYDKSGYWNLNGQTMYDPKAEAEKNAALEITGTGGGGTSTAKTAGGTDAYADHILSILGKTLKLPSIDENGQLQVSFQGYDKLPGTQFETWAIGDADKEKKFYSQVQSLYKSGDVTGAIALMKAHGNTGFYDANGNYYGWVIGYDGSAAKTWQPVLGGKIITTGESDTDIWLTPDGKILNGSIGGTLTDNGLTWTTAHTTGDFLDNSWMQRMNELGVSYADIFNAKAAHGDFTNPELNTAEGNMRAYLRFTTKPDMMDEEDWARISQIFTPEFLATFLAAALAGGVSSSVGTSFIESLLGLDTSKVYDSGGILRGTGGIKATARDELVLPPDITERLLSPVGNNIVRDRMDDLREMLGLKPESGTINNSSIGTQNNGDTYTMNGVTLTEGAARTTTVYDLAQMARSLGAYQRS